MGKSVKISDLVLRDAHQSLHATRMTTADMLPICDKLDSIGLIPASVFSMNIRGKVYAPFKRHCLKLPS